MAAQVESIRKKFYARKWILHHLGHVGFSKQALLKVYRSVILPIHGYRSCVYNSSLTQLQVSALERLQAQALKTIYGYEHSYRSLLELTGLQTLQAQQDARTLKLARKCTLSQRFKDCFPLQPIERRTRTTRHALTYQEKHARTKRLYNSPLFHMRRLLNQQLATWPARIVEADLVWSLFPAWPNAKWLKSHSSWPWHWFEPLVLPPPIDDYFTFTLTFNCTALPKEGNVSYNLKGCNTRWINLRLRLRLGKSKPNLSPA